MHSICSLVKHCEGLKNIRQPLFSSRKQGIWRGEAYKFSYREVTYLSKGTRMKMKPSAV